MQKAIAIYFSDPGAMDYPFHKEEYFQRYRDIAQEMEEKGVKIFFVRGKSYLGKGKFKKGWIFLGKDLVEWKEEIHADLIFNRDDKNTIPRIEDCSIVNPPEFDELCVDKIKSATLFPEFSPKTDYIHSFNEFQEKIKKWKLSPNEKLVLKKNFQAEGRGVFILPLKEIVETLYDDWAHILVQEFLDSSIGIPGVVEGLHDLRVTVVNEVPINAFVRSPKVGSYLANIAQGGKGRAVDLEEIPPEVIAMMHQINAKLSPYFPSLYSADFMRSQKGYKLIELNSRPGVQHPNWSPSYQKFNQAIIKMLLSAIHQ